MNKMLNLYLLENAQDKKIKMKQIDLQMTRKNKTIKLMVFLKIVWRKFKNKKTLKPINL